MKYIMLVGKNDVGNQAKTFDESNARSWKLWYTIYLEGRMPANEIRQETRQEFEMKTTTKKQRNVMIVLRLSGAAGRDMLSGIFLFTKKHPHWHTRIFQTPDEFTPELFSSLKEEGCDGIIASNPGPDETARLVRDSDIPVAFIGDPGPILSERQSHIAFARSDDEFTGCLGARYLVSLDDYKAYGFVPAASGRYWSDARQKGFVDELAARGANAEVFRSPGADGSQEDLAALRKWLSELPKPAAVMAARDSRAMQVLDVCREARIDCPRQLAVIGVDNDELLDEACIPPLTSIQPNHEKLGYAAALLLDRLMSNREGSDRSSYLLRPLQVVTRESASATSAASRLLTKAMDYIRKNATKGIRADDVAKHLGVSRRLADLRFQQYCDQSLNETITYHKLDAVKKMLATTTRPIKEISKECGYADIPYLKMLFKRRFGCTMRDWRKVNSTYAAAKNA